MNIPPLHNTCKLEESIHTQPNTISNVKTGENIVPAQNFYQQLEEIGNGCHTFNCEKNLASNIIGYVKLNTITTANTVWTRFSTVIPVQRPHL